MYRSIRASHPRVTARLRRRLKLPNAAMATPATRRLRLEKDAFGKERVAYQEHGWQVWNWHGVDVNYIALGNTGPPLLLIHGFGASAYQWRYNIPSLAQHHRVYAIDLVGFGQSEKLVVDYTGARLWSQQISDFIEEFVGAEGAYVAGNSLGGLAALATAARNPKKIKGIVGLNIAGTFSQDIEILPSDDHRHDDDIFTKIVRNVGSWLRRLVVLFAFYTTRARIRKILLNVYYNKTNVDDDLVRSIEKPAEDPVAGEVYYSLMQSMLSKGVTIDGLLAMIDVPLLLLWGMKDPWITPNKAQQIIEAYEKAELVPIEAGHCVMDECPDVVNQNLVSWIAKNEGTSVRRRP